MCFESGCAGVCAVLGAAVVHAAGFYAVTWSFCKSLDRCAQTISSMAAPCRAFSARCVDCGSARGTLVHLRLSCADVAVFIGCAFAWCGMASHSQHHCAVPCGRWWRRTQQACKLKAAVQLCGCRRDPSCTACCTMSACCMSSSPDTATAQLVALCICLLGWHCCTERNGLCAVCLPSLSYGPAVPARRALAAHVTTAAHGKAGAVQCFWFMTSCNRQSQHQPCAGTSAWQPHLASWGRRCSCGCMRQNARSAWASHHSVSSWQHFQ